MSEVALRPDVPVDYHPDALLGLARALDVDATIGRAALAAAREALTAMYRVYSAMNDAEKALQAAAPPARRRQQPAEDPTALLAKAAAITGDVRLVRGKPIRFTGRENEFAEAATQAFEAASTVVDRRLKELAGFREGLAKRVTDALDNPARRTAEGLALASEVRAHIKGLSDSKRWEFVASAIGTRDKATVAAILAAPPFLSGLTARQQASMRELAAQEFTPVDHAQLAATEAAIERVQRASGAFLARYAKVLELRNTPKAKADDGLARLRQAAP
jgi:hypothetical protein